MLRNSVNLLRNRSISIRSASTRSLEHLSRDKPIPGLFSVQGWQRGCFDRVDHYSAMLTNNIKGNEVLQNKSLETLISECGLSASKRDIGSYASLIYNLNFAIASLKGCQLELPKNKPTREILLENPDLSLNFNNEPNVTGNTQLQDAIESSFGSLVQFRTLLLNSNLSISGDGFTWLVARIYKPKIQTMRSQVTGEVKFDELFVFNTYNAGSPFTMNKSNIMNNLDKEYKRLEKERNSKDGETEKVQSNTPSSYYNEILSYEELKDSAINDTTYVPLLAVDASPKMWLHDYGVFGKKEYLNRIWDSIDWNVVEDRLPPKYELKYK